MSLIGSSYPYSSDGGSQHWCYFCKSECCVDLLTMVLCMTDKCSNQLKFESSEPRLKVRSSTDMFTVKIQ